MGETLDWIENNCDDPEGCCENFTDWDSMSEEIEEKYKKKTKNEKP